MANDASELLTGSMPLLSGAEQDLGEYRGDVVLVVNTASRCGLTPQYEALQSLYAAKRDEGLVILGFPANDFMEQEPGSDSDIAEFCQVNYGVQFPMFAKTTVVGEGANPLFRRLAAQSAQPEWNFAKYLIDREGRLVEKFPAQASPDDPQVVEAIDRLL